MVNRAPAAKAGQASNRQTSQILMTDEVASDHAAGEGEVAVSVLINQAAADLARAGIDDPRREARLLLAHALCLTPDELRRLPANQLVRPSQVRHLVARRAAREPFAFITGRTGFWTLDVAVSPATLIPRADSESLIEAAIALRDRRAVRAILDLGCGTGCLLLAALSEFNWAYGIGVDRSEAACRLAQGNAARNTLSERASFICADWSASLAGGFDLVLCNPPYIPTAEITSLMPEVASHEPASALDGGPDGLHSYRHLIPELPALLAPDGLAIVEIGQGQSDAVALLAQAAGLALVRYHSDLSGAQRAIVLAREAGFGTSCRKTVGRPVSLG